MIKQILDTVAEFQRAAVDSSLWGSALTKIAGIFDSNIASLEYHAVNANDGIILTSSLNSEAMVRNYIELFIKTGDERRINLVKRLLRSGQNSAYGKTFSNRDVDNPKLVNTLDYYQWHREYIGTEDFLGSFIPAADNGFYTVSVQLPFGRKKPDESDITLFDQLVPHVTQALDTSRLLSGHSGAIKSLLGSFEEQTYSIALLNTRKEIAYTNAAIARLFRETRLVSGERNIFTVNESSTNRLTFNLAFKAAIDSLRNPLYRPSSSFALRGIYPKDNLLCRFFVIPELSSWPFVEPLLLLLIRNPGIRRQTNTQVLAQIYALTKTEAKVAELIAKGNKPSRVAVLLSVSVHTLRNHLKAIYKKTDTGGQLELALLVNTWAL